MTSHFELYQIALKGPHESASGLERVAAEANAHILMGLGEGLPV